MRNRRCQKTIMFFVLPLCAYLGFFFFYPLLYNIYISMYSYRLGGIKAPVGFLNYNNLCKDTQFMQSIATTFIFVLVAVAIQFLLGFAGAAVLSRENKFTNFVRSLVLSPTVLTPLVVGLIWKALYQPDLGVISYYLRRLGVPIGRGLIVERSTALLAVILIDVWEWTPLVMLIILAGLKGLPKEPFEAAIIDGASRYHMLRYITLPLLRPIFLIALLMRSLDAIKVFDIIWATTGGGPGTVTTVANLRIYEVGINQLQIGYAAAMSNFLLVLSLSLGFFFVYILLSRKYTHESY